MTLTRFSARESHYFSEITRKVLLLLQIESMEITEISAINLW